MENTVIDLNKSFLDIVKEEFDRRCSKSSQYSLRAYSQSIGVSPATLSLYFAKKIELTPKMFNIISKSLKLPPEAITHYQDVVLNNKDKKRLINYNVDGHSELHADEFTFISDWYHYAILEIFSLKEHRDEPVWIAGKLGITEIEIVEEAIERLIKLNLLTKNAEGKIQNVDKFTSILDFTHSSAAMRERQKQIMRLSQEKIDSVDISHRDHSGLTMAIDTKLLPEIKDKITKFRRSLGNYIGKNSISRNEVYEIQISFFPLTEAE